VSIRHTLAIVLTFVAGGIATTYLPVTESAADAPRPATSIPAPDPLNGWQPFGDVTGPDGTVHTGCRILTDDTSYVLCEDGFSAES
jgi:hypothetical protein